MRVQVCSNDIFRIKYSTGNFKESVMERYGIIKTDWDAVEVNFGQVNGNTVISTPRYKMIIEQATGNTVVKDNEDNIVLEGISKVGDNELKRQLGRSLNEYFSGTRQSDAIIGLEGAEGPAYDPMMDEVEDTSKSSIIGISLKDGERFYGGGSTSRNNIQHRGTALRMWATYQKTEIPIPFIVSSNGWGIFNNTTVKNYFDIGRFSEEILYVYNTQGDPDFYLLLGNEMPDAINLYTQVTGRPYLLPKWAYGLAFGGNMMEDQLDIMNDALRFRENDIPCDIFWLEPQWMEKRYDFSTAKNWDLSRFPAEPYWKKKKYPKYEDESLFISRLHGLGFKLALWLCIDHDMTIAEEDRLASASNTPLSGKEHWFDHLTHFIDQGVDGFKLDPAKTLDEHPDRKYYNGLTDKEMHNLNQVLLPKQMYETFRNHKGVRSFHHYCGGYAGIQHWGVSTSGDNGGGISALFDQLNLGMSGYMNTSADILVEVTDNKEAMHMGFFLPWLQVNSWYNLLHPWYMSPDEKETFKYYAKLRYSLFPYIYSTALKGSKTGMPIVRAMPLEFPNDREVDNLANQFMFGENLLVGAYSKSIYLPEGNWINFWNNEKVTGGEVIFPYIPEERGGALFIRQGAILPFQKPGHYIGENVSDTLKLRIYPYERSSYTLWEDDGLTYEYEEEKYSKTAIECDDSRKSTVITLSHTEGSYKGMPQRRTWEVEVYADKKPSRVHINGNKTGNWRYDNGLVYITMEQNHVHDTITLELKKYF